MKEIYPDWAISIRETSNNCYTAKCTDKQNRIVEHTGTDPQALELRCLEDVKYVEREKETKRLSDSLCDRRDLKSLSILIPGILSQNGLTDGWHDFYDSLIELKQMRRKDLTEIELSSLLHLISLVAEITNPNQS
ncbi:Unannotated [Lentimonas sp. CC4]|nr:hypothetical protein [Lentimonas sp. CC4]CAA6687028.1 Unannotated [Lentimonas sp. CC6]CAA7172003.1 Unannotated [Lentimonas sp. CC21]CAA7182934.1 Unannotated [Lentimonas sp. CC8]CAA6678054.1 Unannotated [Lentimonas sp. CC4]CAA7075871.1 Unannotated [Lentimonas sp. CC4]